MEGTEHAEGDIAYIDDSGNALVLVHPSDDSGLYEVQENGLSLSTDDSSPQGSTTGGFHTRLRQSCHIPRRLSYSANLDKLLADWIAEKQSGGTVVTREMFHKFALPQVRKEVPTFKASSGWLEKFLTRHNLNLPAIKEPSQGPPIRNDRVPSGLDLLPSSAEVPTMIPTSISPMKPRGVPTVKDRAFSACLRRAVEQHMDKSLPLFRQHPHSLDTTIMVCKAHSPDLSEMQIRKKIRSFLKNSRRQIRKVKFTHLESPLRPVDTHPACPSVPHLTLSDRTSQTANDTLFTSPHFQQSLPSVPILPGVDDGRLLSGQDLRDLKSLGDSYLVSAQLLFQTYRAIASYIETAGSGGK